MRICELARGWRPFPLAGLTAAGRVGEQVAGAGDQLAGDRRGGDLLTLSRIAEADDPAEIIDEVASASRRMREQFADVIRVMLSTAPHDPVVAGQLTSATAVYRAAFVPIAERLAQLGALRPGTDTGHAVDVLWFYFGYSSYFTLHDDNGWSYQRAEHWLAEQARRELLAPAHA